jgi:hypothetical protein
MSYSIGCFLTHSTNSSVAIVTINAGKRCMQRKLTLQSRHLGGIVPLRCEMIHIPLFNKSRRVHSRVPRRCEQTLKEKTD